MIEASALSSGSAAAGQVPVQQTLARPFEQVGIGLHSGKSVCLRVLPAAPGSGRCFVRVDLPDRPTIPARIDRVGQTLLSTELGNGAATVRTVEHLLAALSGMGIDNVQIELDGAEVPLLDGSALPWVEAIEQAGIVAQAAERLQWSVTEPITVAHGDAFVAAFPADELRFTYGIDFDAPAIGNQWQSWSPDRKSFRETIAPARTFGMVEQIDYLRQQGLIKGGSLDNALVCSRDGWVNPPLRFSNEPVRHKLLDLVGDLSLLGTFPRAHMLAYKASHQLHTQFAARLATLLPV